MGQARFRPGTAWIAVLAAALLGQGAACVGARAAGAGTQAAVTQRLGGAGGQAEGAGTQAALVRQAGAGGAAPLERFLHDLRSLRTHFTQTVTGAHGRIVSQATGELTVLRPGKFRWVIHPLGQGGAADGGAAQAEGVQGEAPQGGAAGAGAGQAGAGQAGAGQGSAGQLLVADGRNLWFYDADLQQVTVRPVSAASLSATPAMLLSGDADALGAFTVSGAGMKDGLAWVQVVPKAADADFKEALLGFSGDELRRMILEDKLGQTLTFSFQDAERNVPVAPSEVSFTPPAGADVIGTPQR